MDFEWDDRKAKENERKHGIRFQEAVTAFRDEKGIELTNDDDARSEERFILIAMSAQRLLFLVFTVRLDSIRIISARKTTSKETDLYNEANQEEVDRDGD